MSDLPSVEVRNVKVAVGPGLYFHGGEPAIGRVVSYGYGMVDVFGLES